MRNRDRGVTSHGEPAGRRERRLGELIRPGARERDQLERPARPRRPWHLSRAKVAVVAASAVVIVGGLTATMSRAAAPASPGNCAVHYTIASQWPGGFGTDITLTNTGPTALTTWTLTWSFANGQTIYQHWGTDLDSNGSAITATSEPNEGFIAAGGTFHLGFLGHWSGTNAAPAAFALNGKACSVGGSTVATSSAPATTAKPTAKPVPAKPVPAKPTAKPVPAKPAPAPVKPASGTCAVIYEIESEWPAGGHKAFQGDIQIVNLTAQTLTSWSLGWTFPNDQVIYQHWGTDLDQNGQKIVATSEPNEGYLAGNGGRFHLGFLANVTSTNAVPTSFTFNGATCPLVDDNLKPVVPAQPAPANGGAGTAATTTKAPAGGSCQAIYEIETSWPTATGRAFLGDVQLVNTTASVLTTWSFGWTFGGNQAIYQSWGADFSQQAHKITANSEPNEGYVAANGGRFHMGFLANYTGTNAVPTGFVLNGTPCTLIEG